MERQIRNPAPALGEYAFWLERELGDTHRIKAYRAAAEVAEALSDEDLAGLRTAADWQRLPSFGPSTAGLAVIAARGDLPPKLATARTKGAAPLDPAGLDLRLELRGDLHLHTNASDGGSPLLEMARTGQALGHEYLAITDHSPRLRVANGLSAERLAAQWEQIDDLQAGLDIQILRGIEVDILIDGALDQSEAMLAGTDIVVASVHSDLRAAADQMTARMVAAISNPHTTVLGHCTGRKLKPDGSWRPQSDFDADVVFTACEMFGVAVEINSRPERQDPPLPLLELARDAGCLFAINTDAHAPGQLDFQTYGAARATAAGIPAERIINTWPVADLLAHSRRNRPGR